MHWLRGHTFRTSHPTSEVPQFRHQRQKYTTKPTYGWGLVRKGGSLSNASSALFPSSHSKDIILKGTSARLLCDVSSCSQVQTPWCKLNIGPIGTLASPVLAYQEGHAYLVWLWVLCIKCPCYIWLCFISLNSLLVSGYSACLRGNEKLMNIYQKTIMLHEGNDFLNLFGKMSYFSEENEMI